MRIIAFLTGSRGEWGYIRPIIKAIEEDEGLDYQIIATHMHLLPEFGLSINEIQKEGFRISEKLYMTFDGYNSHTMVKSLGVLLLELPTILQRLKPDILLLAGDRGEQLMGAIAAGHLGIPVAHIQAGELSGNIDGIVRHAITKLAHIHFAANEEFAQRVTKLGEQKFRIFNTGAPQLDELVSGMFTPISELNNKFNIKSEEKILLAVQHPVTEEEQYAGEHTAITINALNRCGLKTIMIYPNADAGSEDVRKSINSIRGNKIFLFRNLAREDYLGLMRRAEAIVGNSSSGILEAPTFGLPCVNIGNRQKGRPQASNVINVDYDEAAIIDAINKAISPDFQEKARNSINPYGDGYSSKRIADILKTIPLNDQLLNKEMTY
jgi:GDP/UDP-N,N'-diacetylbacillosamine 2-epimerase (hydrolysing)